MADIALYNLLRRIPDATDDEVERAVNDVASSREVATKADLANLETRIIEKMANLETRLTRQMYGAVGIILAGVGLMIKFL